MQEDLGMQEDLVQLSKCADGRARLVASGELERAAAAAAQALSAAWPPSTADHAHSEEQEQLLVQLRLLRNCCAAGAAAAAVLLPHAVPSLAAEFAAAAARRCVDQQQQQQLEQQLLLAAVQLLANLSAASAVSAAAVWDALFPDRLAAILSAQQGATHEAAALAVLSCVRSSQSVLADLTSAAAQHVWQQLLAPMMMPSAAPPPSAADAAAGAESSRAAAAAAGHANDNVCLLIKFVALQQSRLQQVLDCLCSDGRAAPGAVPPSSGSSSSARCFAPSEAQAVLLHVVALELAGTPAASPLPGQPAPNGAANGASEQPAGWLQSVVSLLRVVWQQAVAAAAPGTGVCSQPTAGAHVLEATLQVLRAVLAREEETEDSSGRSSRDIKAAAAAGISAAAQQLASLGLAPLLLDMLKALGPPPKSKQEQQRQLEQQAQAPEAHQQPRQHRQPYAGYRGDVIAVLSNLVFEQRAVQDAVLAGGGVELLLNNCNLDDTAPMAREWALWAVRNMCQDNEAVQAYVSKFQAVAPVQTPELDRMGMELQLDGLSHRLKLVKKPGEEPQLVVPEQQ